MICSTFCYLKLSAVARKMFALLVTLAAEKDDGVTDVYTTCGAGMEEASRSTIDQDQLLIKSHYDIDD